MTFTVLSMKNARMITAGLASLGFLAAALCSAGQPAQASSPAALRPPHCTTAVASAPRLSHVRTALVTVGSGTYPFAVATASRGHWSFVAAITNANTEAGRVEVFRTTSFAPVRVRSVRLSDYDEILGASLTPDGRYLVGATNNGLAVLSVARLERGLPHPVLGTLAGPKRSSGGIEAVVSPDGRYVFVSLEDSADLAVFNLARALRDGFGRRDLVGVIPMGLAPVGLGFSPGGRWLYGTSELGQPFKRGQGTLTVINVHQAERDPAQSVVSTVDAGCGTVRVIATGRGVVWVTARESDALLAFSAAALRTDPRRALIADVRVGEAPVGLALVDRAQRIVVADSNRFYVKGARASLAVVSVPAALAGGRAVLGYVRSGLFPRQMALEPGGRTMLVTNFDSDQLEAVNLADLP
jgi:DNA-binding beta-propeller fold protein YncE